MSAPRLPDGFAVQIDRRVRALGDSALLGGSPTRLLKLSPTARSLIDGTDQQGRVEVRDATSAQLARVLLDATVAHPRPPSGPANQDVTVVIPVRDNEVGLHRLVMSLRGTKVIVVDDGSVTPVLPAVFDGARCEVEIVRHERSRGPAAARNTGLEHCATDFVAFLDSDVLPCRGWLEALLGHFCDPAVALAAPRIVGLGAGAGLIARYEVMHSALDLGDREAPVLPYGRVPYVPAAALVCRRSAVEQVAGFDESLLSGEDVDLCWRLVDAGFRLRYEPVALVSHEHRTRPREWLSRRAFYGSSAAPLAIRHPANTAPLVIPRWSLVAWILLALGLAAGSVRVGMLATLVGGVAGARTARALRGTDAGAGESARLVARSLGAGALHLSAAVCRHYWPVAVIAAVVSRRCRRAVLAAALIDGIGDWANRRPYGDGKPIGPLGYLVLKRLDDGAYGAGLWSGAARERTLRPLRPEIV